MERHPRRAPIPLLQEMKPDRESAGPSCAGGSVVSLNAPSGAQLGLESLQPPWPRAPGLSLAGSNNPDPAASSSTTQESFPALGGILWNIPKWPRAWIWNDLKKEDLNEKYAQDAPSFPSGGEDSLVPADSQEQAPFQGSTEPHLH